MLDLSGRPADIGSSLDAMGVTGFDLRAFGREKRAEVPDSS